MSGLLSSTKNPIDISFRAPARPAGSSAVDEHRLLADPEHVGDRVAVDVGVEHADPAPEPRERRREVHRQGRLADPALARGDRDDPCRRVELDRLVALWRAAAASSSTRPAPPGASRRSRQLRPCDPGDGADLAATWSWKELRSGQPATVSAIVTGPHRRDRIPRTMSSSVTGLRSSGSITLRAPSITALATGPSLRAYLGEGLPRFARSGPRVRRRRRASAP